MAKHKKKRHYLTDDDVSLVRQMIEDQHLQQWKVAEKIGVHPGTIEKLFKTLGLKTERTGPRSGPGHTNWKGGRTRRKGYWYIWCPDHPFANKAHYILESHLVMEKKLCRYLQPGEVVHHRDGDPNNNAPDNLIVFGSNGSHLKHELKGRCPKWTLEGWKRILEGTRNKGRKLHDTLDHTTSGGSR